MTKPPVHSTIAWATSIGVLIVADVIADRKHNSTTLSENVRHVCRTDTQAGKVVFTVLWGGFAAWMVTHILVPAVEGSIGT